MQFVVPQFIDVEDKIIGPISVRQFLILLVTAGMIFVQFKVLSFIPFLILGVLTFGIGGVFAFMRVNGQGFHYFLLNILYALKSPSLRVWKKEDMNRFLVRSIVKQTEQRVSPRKHVTASRLAELSLIVDTGGAWKKDL